MDLYERAEKIKNFLAEKISYTPQAAVVLGSGLGSFAEEIEADFEIPYSDIEGFPVSTVPGHKGRLIFGKTGGKNIVAMQGRFHFYEGCSIYHRRSRRTDVHFPCRQAAADGHHGADRRGRLFLHGTGSGNPAADHEASDVGKGEKD